jgi:hypothetical protein
MEEESENFDLKEKKTIDKIEETMINYNFENVNGLIKSIFLLLLALSGGYVAQTLGCKTQKLLTENMYVKHIVIIMLVYFTSSVFSEDKNPNENIKTSILIYLFYLLFTKMNIYFTISVFILLGINYILSTYVKYYEKQEIEEARIDLFKDYQKKLTIGAAVLVITGFTLYANEKYKEYGKGFSLKTFMFGVLTCDSLK